VLGVRVFSLASSFGLHLASALMIRKLEDKYMITTSLDCEVCGMMGFGFKLVGIRLVGWVGERVEKSSIA